MKLASVNQSGGKLPHKMLLRWIKGCEKSLKARDRRRLEDKELLIVFVSKSQIKKLNAEFRGKDYATDILSFESIEEDSLGELVLSPEVVREQSKRTGLTYHQELCYMILHGILHLLGYDHETTKKEAKVMFDLQNRVFDLLAPKFDFR